ncbi:hypothetical protein V6N11_068764 [Hibiscus sabdariffa]|uniref:Uncharacterized protein n=1 Tax=Hibiscus sabdariffa TaxID=183260 RepID=A0ABR2PAQ5_9ROSI
MPATDEISFTSLPTEDESSSSGFFNKQINQHSDSITATLVPSLPLHVPSNVTNENSLISTTSNSSPAEASPAESSSRTMSIPMNNSKPISTEEMHSDSVDVNDDNDDVVNPDDTVDHSVSAEAVEQPPDDSENSQFGATDECLEESHEVHEDTAMQNANTDSIELSDQNVVTEMMVPADQNADIEMAVPREIPFKSAATTNSSREMNSIGTPWLITLKNPNSSQALVIWCFESGFERSTRGI